MQKKIEKDIYSDLRKNIKKDLRKQIDLDINTCLRKKWDEGNLIIAYNKRRKPTRHIETPPNGCATEVYAKLLNTINKIP